MPVMNAQYSRKAKLDALGDPDSWQANMYSVVIAAMRRGQVLKGLPVQGKQACIVCSNNCVERATSLG